MQLKKLEGKIRLFRGEGMRLPAGGGDSSLSVMMVIFSSVTTVFCTSGT